MTKRNLATSVPMREKSDSQRLVVNRRLFLKNSMVAGAATTMGIGLLTSGPALFAHEGPEENSGPLTKGDAAILRFLAAAEILETDLWQQYNELGGIQDQEVPGRSGNKLYTLALQKLDMDMPQYTHGNTEDEFTHFTFINAFLAFKGADTQTRSIWISFAPCRVAKRQGRSKLDGSQT